MNTIIKCIGLDDKVPVGYRYLLPFECQYLLDKDFSVFKDLEYMNYYYLILGKDRYRLLWLRRLDYDSYVDGNLRDLSGNNRVRGVLIINKDFKVGEDELRGRLDMCKEIREWLTSLHTNKFHSYESKIASIKDFDEVFGK